MLIFMLREPTSARDSEALPSNTHYGMAGGCQKQRAAAGDTHEICEADKSLRASSPCVRFWDASFDIQRLLVPMGGTSG